MLLIFSKHVQTVVTDNFRFIDHCDNLVITPFFEKFCIKKYYLKINDVLKASREFVLLK